MLGMQTDMGGSVGVVGVRDTQSAIGLPEAKNEPSQPKAAPPVGSRLFVYLSSVDSGKEELA